MNNCQIQPFAVRADGKLPLCNLVGLLHTDMRAWCEQQIVGKPYTSFVAGNILVLIWLHQYIFDDQRKS